MGGRDVLLLDRVPANDRVDGGVGVYRSRLEQCDDGNTLGGDGCSETCVVERCGDGMLQANEACDDGNNVSRDGCTADCVSHETCGNGIVDIHLPNTRMTAPQLCSSASATDTQCAELCDDGNNVSGDGCSQNCLSDERCPNGIVDPLGDPRLNPQQPELCDDGNSVDGDDCRSDCQGAEVCGNGLIDLGEQCDDFGEKSPSCDVDCTLPTCGDSLVNDFAGEACDPGSIGSNTLFCDSDCTFPECGDGIVNHAYNEECDGGQIGEESQTCDDDCSVPVCGDGNLNAAAGEACDPGTPGSSIFNCDLDCTAPECGDDIVNTSANEVCEPPSQGTCSASCT